MSSIVIPYFYRYTPSYMMTKQWLEFPVLCNISMLLIYFICSSWYLLIIYPLLVPPYLFIESLTAGGMIHRDWIPLSQWFSTPQGNHLGAWKNPDAQAFYKRETGIQLASRESSENPYASEHYSIQNTTFLPQDQSFSLAPNLFCDWVRDPSILPYTQEVLGECLNVSD